MLDKSIILIGPVGAGKTTLSEQIGAALNVPAFDIDALRWDYFKEIGYDAEYAKEMREKQGFTALVSYWKPFEIHAVERVTQDYPTGHVIAFGAGFSVYEDPAHLERAKKALAPFPHVVLLLPSADIDESLDILDARLQASEPDANHSFYEMIRRFNRHFIEHPSNNTLAKLTVYTKDQTPEQTCAEILERTGLR
jgi:shikimate kinase